MKIKDIQSQYTRKGVAEGRVAQLPTRGADYSEYDTDHLKMMLRPGVLHRDEARFKALIRKELHKREQQSQQDVAEGSEESYVIIRTDAGGKKDVFAGNFDTYEQAQKELDDCLAHPLHTKYKQKFEIKRKGQPGVAEGNDGYDDESTRDEYMNLQSGDYVRDTQDSSGEVFIMRGQPDDRRVRIEDKDGRGWNIAPYRLIAVDPDDQAIGHYFNDMNEASAHAKQVAAKRKEYNKGLGKFEPTDDMVGTAKIVRGIAMSDASPEHKKAAIDALNQPGVAEGAPELLKKEMPLHRHAEKLLAQNGVSKDDPDYHHHLGNTIKHLRQFGNIDLINKQGVAEGSGPEKRMSVDQALEIAKKNNSSFSAKDYYNLVVRNEGLGASFFNKEVMSAIQKKQGVAEGLNSEYDDEAGMAQGNLYTIATAAQGLLDTIDDRDNLPEWAQEKIAKVEGMLVTVWNYLQSQKARGIDPKVNESICTPDEAEEIFNDFEHSVHARGLSEDIYDTVTDDQIILETAAWRRSAGKSKKGGLNAKGVASYRAEHPGSKLQMAVTTKPSKLKPGSKAAKRRKSFCARMSGVKGPAKKPNGKPTRKTLALRKWNC